ncbi:MAG TPA: MerR family transcriptional regulator [Stenomitos sp.]
MSDVKQYPIKAASRLTGVMPDTLRAWERRYGAIAPQRGDTSIRLYSEGDVERIMLLKHAVDAGHSIGRIAHLSLDQLKALGPVVEHPAEAIRPDVLERILQAIQQFDYVAADRELGVAAALMTPPQLVRQVAVPLMKVIGDRWAMRLLGVANEHLATALLRSLLGTLLRTTPTSRPARLLLTTPPGELHELGLLSVALLAAAHGYSVCYLGTDLPVHEVAYAAARSGANVVGLSLVYTDDPKKRAHEVFAIAEALAPTVQLWLGGPGVRSLPGHRIPEGARTFETFAEVEAGLAELERVGP